MVSSGDSSATQPYLEEELEQQLMDSGCSGSGEKSNAANPVQKSSGTVSPAAFKSLPIDPVSPISGKKSNAANAVQFSFGFFSSAAYRTSSSDPGGSASVEKSNAANAVQLVGENFSPVACQTPSPCRPPRANFETNAAVAAHSREPSVSPSGTSPAHPCVSIASPRPVSNNLHCLQSGQHFEDPLSTRKDDVLRRTGASESGTFRGGNLSFIEQAGTSSPSLPNSAGAGASTTPVAKEWEVRGGSSTLGVKRVFEETEHTQKRPVARSLFPPSNAKIARKSSPDDVLPNLLELNHQSIQQKICGVETEGATNTLPCPPDVERCEIGRVPGKSDSQPCSNEQTVIREEGSDKQYGHMFDDQQPISWPAATEHLQALGNLDFAKVFQVLEWLKGNSLESLNVEVIKKLKTVSQANVQTYLSQLDGVQNRELSGEKKCIKNPQFGCYVNRTGGLQFKISEQRERLTALQRCFGRDRVLKIFFAGPGFATPYRKVMQEGIIAGLRHYQYWTHKDTGNDFKKTKKPVDEEFESSTHCYFVCTSSQAESDKSDPGFRQFRTIGEARCLMMHIHTTPNEHKYSSRLQLALSQTQPVDLDFSTIDVQLDKDILCKDETGRETICTDGTGYISVDLAKEIAISLKNGKPNPEKLFGDQDYPALIQIRLFHTGSAYKGTLLTHHLLKPRTIVLRDSMQKVKADPKLSGFPSFNSLEICGHSMRSRDAKLSRDLILLLTLGGVPGSFFMDLLDEAIQKGQDIMKLPKAAWKAIGGFNSAKAELVRRMLLAGIPPTEPFLQKTIVDLRNDLVQDFRQGKVVLPNSRYLYGAADPTGTLKPNQKKGRARHGIAELETFRDHGLVSWPRVLVYKSPGKHPGDIHEFEAIANEEILKIVGDGQFVLLFSTQGSRSVPDEIANSDLDGDRYFITWNKKLLADFVEYPTPWFPKPVKTTERTMGRPADLSSQQLEGKLIEKFINTRFDFSGDVGIVSNWWLAHMDQYLLLREFDIVQASEHYRQALDLVDPIYALLDSEKTGKKVDYPKQLNPRKVPHFREKTPKSQNTFVKGSGVTFNCDEYKSTSVLGKIYDKAIHAEEIWRLTLHEKFDFERAFDIKEIKGNKLPDTDLFMKWKELFSAYRREMARHIKATNKSDDSVKEAGNAAIFATYKNILYGAESLDKSRTELDTIFANASAIYAAVFEHENCRAPRSDGDDRPPSFYFAWMVAGEALFRMHEKYHRSNGKEPLFVSYQAFDNLGFNNSHPSTSQENRDL